MAKVNFVELNKALKPIHRNTVKSIEKNSAHFIYADRTGSCKCERCGGEFTLATKHRGSVKCPSCKKNMTAIHTWRKSKNQSIHWEVVANALDESVLALRYYLVIREDGQIIESEERARMFFDFANRKEYKFEFSIWDTEWRKGGRRFFRQYGMSYAENRLFCMGAKIRSQFFTEIRKLDAFKYLDISSIWKNGYYATSIAHFYDLSSIYEKLIKVGLNELVTANVNNYIPSRDIAFDKNETELTKMLGITKHDIEMLKTKPTLIALKYLQTHKNSTESEFNALADLDEYSIKRVNDVCELVNASPLKVANYIEKQGISILEYSSHINSLNSRNYNILDKNYTFPHDFAKEHARFLDEEKRIADKDYAERDELICEIRDKLHAIPRLKKFFEEGNDYIIHVPSNQMDFINEGISQHNCVGKGNFAKSVSKGEKLVFFIRECRNQDASFVTMEYAHGTIIQCMLKNNERVNQNSKVYSFCTEFVNALNELNVLSA